MAKAVMYVCVCVGVVIYYSILGVLVVGDGVDVSDSS